MKSSMTEEEKKVWQKYFTKYLQILNGTGKAKLPEDVYRSFNNWYTKYIELQDMKKDIVSDLI